VFYNRFADTRAKSLNSRGRLHIKRTGMLVAPLGVEKAVLVPLRVFSLKRSIAVPFRVLSRKNIIGDNLFDNQLYAIEGIQSIVFIVIENYECQ